MNPFEKPTCVRCIIYAGITYRNTITFADSFDGTVKCSAVKLDWQPGQTLFRGANPTLEYLSFVDSRLCTSDCVIRFTRFTNASSYAHVSNIPAKQCTFQTVVRSSIAHQDTTTNP